jgi:hypothetical protein
MKLIVAENLNSTLLDPFGWSQLHCKGTLEVLGIHNSWQHVIGGCHNWVVVLVL